MKNGETGRTSGYRVRESIGTTSMDVSIYSLESLVEMTAC